MLEYHSSYYQVFSLGLSVVMLVTATFTSSFYQNILTWIAFSTEVNEQTYKKQKSIPNKMSLKS